ncbi:MAG: hypothetical protein ACLS61_15575 [Ruminococcus sp.]
MEDWVWNLLLKRMKIISWKAIVNKNDKYKMNWVAPGEKWGEMFLPDGITGRIERTVSTKGKITEKYIFVNNRDREYFHKKGEIGIAVPFPDNYTAAEICMRERCHAHIRCGESQSILPGSEWEEKIQILGWF